MGGGGGGGGAGGCFFSAFHSRYPFARSFVRSWPPQVSFSFVSGVVIEERNLLLILQPLVLSSFAETQVRLEERLFFFVCCCCGLVWFGLVLFLFLFLGVCCCCWCS